MAEEIEVVKQGPRHCGPTRAASVSGSYEAVDRSQPVPEPRDVPSVSGRNRIPSREARR
ncbi:hypothetical protein [Streptomyces sp. WM6372]|uniref:hypothetical protein n=1 Tax=Streptomyces sp. WM6372 TaxID=1415555 RepID=UPI000B134E9C|nr:hypothetical protein [Streptomyces sp. WM6372]